MLVFRRMPSLPPPQRSCQGRPSGDRPTGACTGAGRLLGRTGYCAGLDCQQTTGQTGHQRAGLGEIQAGELATPFLLGTRPGVLVRQTIPRHGDTSSDSTWSCPTTASGLRPELPLRQAIAAGGRQCDGPPTQLPALGSPAHPFRRQCSISCCARTSASLGLWLTDALVNGGRSAGQLGGRWRSGGAGLCRGSDLLLMPADDDAASSPARSPAERAGSPWPGLEQEAWSGRERHPPYVAAGPRPGVALSLGDLEGLDH